MKVSIEDSKKVLDDYINEVHTWYGANSLNETPTYDSLLDKKVWGTKYQQDINYFRQLSDIKSKFIALKGYFSKLKAEMQVPLQIKADNVIKYIQEQIKLVENKMWGTKEQLEYYKTVVYVIGSFSYGDYA